MLRHCLGDAVFRRGVADYMKRWCVNVLPSPVRGAARRGAWARQGPAVRHPQPRAAPAAPAAPSTQEVPRLATACVRRQHNSTTESRLWEPLTEAVTQVPITESWPRHQRLPDNLTVAQVMSAWTKTTGYPVVNVTRVGGNVLFTQVWRSVQVWGTRPAGGRPGTRR